MILLFLLNFKILIMNSVLDLFIIILSLLDIIFLFIKVDSIFIFIELVFLKFLWVLLMVNCLFFIEIF